MSDAVTRASEHFQLSIDVATEPDDWGSTLVAFAQSHDIDTFITAYAPVGPVAELLVRARPQLSDRGVSLHEVRRTYDDLTWPHATRGFFGLKKKIPDITESLQRTVSPS